MSPFVLIAILTFTTILIVVSAIVFEKRRNRIRSEQLSENAAALGLTFVKKADDTFHDRISMFQLCGKGRAKKVLNLVVGETEDIDISIFDYHFTTGSGEHSHTHKRSVALIESSTFQTPAFALRPESMFDKIGAVLGMQDIDFDTHPEFSKMYLLKGEDEPGIRKVFDATLLTFLEQKKRICVEAIPGKMIAYYSDRLAKPDQLKTLFAEALEIYGVFRDRLNDMP